MKNLVRVIQKQYKYFRELREQDSYRLFLYLSFSLIGAPILLGFAIYHVCQGEIFEGLRDGLTVLALLANAGLVCVIRKKPVIYFINAALVHLVIFQAFFSGGGNGTTVFWVYILPFISFFLLKRNIAIGFVIVSYAVISIVFFGVPIGPFLPYPYALELKIRVIATFSLVCLLTYIYETVRLRFQHRLEAEHVKLQQEIVERKKAEAALQRAHDELEHRVEQRTAELAQAKEDAELANFAKSNFLRSVSHELHTPLHSILGFSQLLEDESAGLLNEKQRKYIRQISQSGNSLFSMIKQILDLSQIDLGEMELCLEPVHIKSLIEESLKMVREKEFKESLSFRMHASQEIQNFTLQADLQKVKLIVFNLLSNAVKFTSENGEIRIDMTRHADELVVTICDTGFGIPVDEQENIFTNFHQVQSGLSNKASGIGLGLPITKRLVELHGGRLWVESEGEGMGSCFGFSLPIR